MNSLFNKTLYFICLIIGFFLIFKNNQDLNNYYIFIISLIFISSISIVFLPIIKPYTIGKLPIFNLINLFFLRDSTAEKHIFIKILVSLKLTK